MDYWGSDSGWSMGNDEPAIASGGGILVIVFADRLNAGKSLLASAQQLAGESGASVTALLFGGDADDGDALIKAGAESVYFADVADSGLYDGYLAALQEFIGQHSPNSVLLISDERGNIVAGQLAGVLKSPLVVGISSLTVDYSDQSLIVTQPTYGGAAVATWKLGSQPQIVTIRPGMASPLIDKNRRGKTATFEFSNGAANQLINRTISPAAGQELIKASVIVAGGHGAGESGFKLIGELAALLGGVVGATKSAVREGWAEYSQQIGMLGQTVRPRLYIAVGISGTPEHLMGISEGATIVAINNDPAAPIFALADYGIVGDLQAVLPAFIERLQRTI